MTRMDAIEQILDLARWAPSGDNTQPWKFEIVSDTHVVVHGFDTRDHVVYDLDGHPSQMAHGALLETIRIAASQHGLGVKVTQRPDTPETHLLYDVRFEADASVTPDPLAACITTRCVQRRPMSTRPLGDTEKAKLAAAAQPCSVTWFESFGARWTIAKLNFANAHLRLTLPEAYLVHRSVIEWKARYSTDKIPEAAVGVDPLTGSMMRWVMQSWERVDLFNRYFGGTLAPRLQLDLIPGIACAAHACLVFPRQPTSIADYVTAGRAMQRFWLTAESLGLRLQPEMTPLIFSRYHREQRVFTKMSVKQAEAGVLAQRLEAIMGRDEATKAAFLCRLGWAETAASRSLRLELDQLKVARSEGR
ncbi:MAG: nitroreductase family protein [Rhodocyclaceae bacterium]|nr:nitroreductase family protein [Rhodocyclaceae bacterium]MBX3667656.1 nitroreductase family protein [Rhodocyclaceae bacterium]